MHASSSPNNRAAIVTGADQSPGRAAYIIGASLEITGGDLMV